MKIVYFQNEKKIQKGTGKCEKPLLTISKTILCPLRTMPCHIFMKMHLIVYTDRV